MKKGRGKGREVKFIPFSDHCLRTAILLPTDATGHRNFICSLKKEKQGKKRVERRRNKGM
jgi:saccharopine dehydrogenase-like NADP-dependent oxidoreductase